jgi:hypothetical protein
MPPTWCKPWTLSLQMARYRVSPSTFNTHKIGHCTPFRSRLCHRNKLCRHTIGQPPHPTAPHLDLCPDKKTMIISGRRHRATSEAKNSGRTRNVNTTGETRSCLLRLPYQEDQVRSGLASVLGVLAIRRRLRVTSTAVTDPMATRKRWI